MTLGRDGDAGQNGAGDDERPVAADIRVDTGTPNRSTNRPSTADRIVGGLLAFLSLWQVLSPEDATGTLLGLAGLVVSALWFIPCPRYFRLLATAALFAWILVVLRTAPPYAPTHGRRTGAASTAD